MIRPQNYEQVPGWRNYLMQRNKRGSPLKAPSRKSQIAIQPQSLADAVTYLFERASPSLRDHTEAKFSHVRGLSVGEAPSHSDPEASRTSENANATHIAMGPVGSRYLADIAQQSQTVEHKRAIPRGSSLGSLSGS